MWFDKVYFNESEAKNNLNLTNMCSIDTNGGYITFFLNLERTEYTIENDKVIVDDNYLDDIKNKLIKKQKKSLSHLKNKNISEFKHHYIINLYNGYFIADFWEDISDDDIELTVNEFVIKGLLE